MSESIFDIPELTRLEAGPGIVRIPPELDVPFSPRIQAIVDTPEFRRLAEITQLGLVSRVYPGARHTRFEHALGVFHNSLRYLWQLGKDPRFLARVDKHTAEVLMVSALLHDLGHWPFCHTIEDLELPVFPSHERFAAEFLSEGRELPEVLRRDWGIEPAEVLDVLSSQTDSPRMRLVRSILSGPVDVDKLDYLERDSLHAGVPYGRNFDKNRLIQSLTMNAAGDGLAISSKGKTAAELMVFARYVMFSEVYWHHAVRSATSMFSRAFFEMHTRLDWRDLFQKTECEVVSLLRNEARGGPLEPLIDGLFGARRRLYKRVTEATLSVHRDLYDCLAKRSFGFLVECSRRVAASASRDLGQSIQATELLFDTAPTHREVEFRVDIFFPKSNTYRPFEEVSPVVQALARTQFEDHVKRVRIYAHPDIAPQIARWDGLEQAILGAVAEVEG